MRTAQEILDSPSVEFAYLIRRVILRVKEQTVRWLLRYAVVPRRFTYEIFQNVVAPHLEKQLKRVEGQLSKEVTLDKPEETKYGTAEKFINKEIWAKSELKKSDKLDLPTVWSDLRKYASGYGWISFEAADGGVPRLHPEVVRPMRLLLEEQDIYVPLHADAAAYFEGKARVAQDSQSWLAAICEAIYHRFHSEKNKAAAEFWRNQLAAPEAERNSAVLLKIVEQITGADYTEESGFARKRTSQEFLVEPAVIVEAHSRALEVLLSSTADLDKVNWVEVGKHLNMLEQFRKAQIKNSANYRKPFSNTFLRRLTNEMRGKKPTNKKAVSLLRKGLKTTKSQKMVLCFEIWLGDALLAAGNKEALEHYRRAEQFKNSIKQSPIDACEIQFKIGKWYYNQDDFNKSEKICLDAFALAKRENNASVRHKALRYLADLKLKQGKYEAATNLIKKAMKMPEPTGEANLDQLFLSQVQARALLEPLESLVGVEPYLKSDQKLEENDLAEIRKLRADLMGMLMQYPEALSHLEDAGWRA